MTIRSVATTVWKHIVDFWCSIQIFPYPFFVVFGRTSYRVSGKEMRQILDVIKPGDIMLRKFEHYLSAYLIPGYYDHAAVVVSPEHIIHAVREGVSIEDLLTFLRTDRIVIIRCKDATVDDVTTAISRAQESLGRPYDYFMNGRSQKAIYCSELAWSCWKEKMPEIKEKVIIPDTLLECKQFTIIHDSRTWRA